MFVRAASESDLESIMAVLDAARLIMRRNGNVRQWVNAYPSKDIIVDDIRRGYGQVVMENNRIAGYFAFIPSPEPTYSVIYEGSWLDDSQPYHVIHRIGSLPEVHGVFRTLIEWCAAREGNLRIDTHRDNHIMQHLLERNGFHYCGIIFLLSGDERLAYQRLTEV
ncbi:MAG: N-acetyltransferase [Bacteroidales bacterium]|nr:N-acetyltransferase [Bacteroidales bacterium]